MKVFFEERAAIVSIPASHFRVLREGIADRQRVKEFVHIFGSGKDSSGYRIWIIPTAETTPSQLRSVIYRANPGRIPVIETLGGLAIEPTGSREQAQTLAKQIRELASVKAAYVVGDMSVWLAVVPGDQADLCQLKRDIESLASKIG